MSYDVSRLCAFMARKGIIVRYRRVQTGDDAAWWCILNGDGSDGSLLKPYKAKNGRGVAFLVVLAVVLVAVGGFGGYFYYRKAQGIKLAEEQIATQNAAAELQRLRQEAKDLVSYQDRNALNNPTVVDNLGKLVNSKTSSAKDLKAGIKAVEASRKPASDGLSYKEWVKKADTFIAQVKAKNANGSDRDATSTVSMYPTVKALGNAEELKEFVEENQKLL